MPTRDTDTRTVTLVDIPLVKRLVERGTVLDSEMGCTRYPNGLGGTLFANILLRQRGFQTLVTRSRKRQVVGQFRMRGEDQNAQIMCIAPRLDGETDDTAWLHILDAMAREAGKQNAHALIAEVEEDSGLFETMRTAGFAVYARQEIWRRLPGDYLPVENSVDLTEQTEADAQGIQSLFASTVPSLVQQITTLPDDLNGLVYRKNDRTEAYLAVTEGKHGVYIMPYLHPDISLQAPAVIDMAIRRNARTTRLPVYVCVRRHQEWLASVLEKLGFEPGPRQAVMVRHITAGVRHANFAPVEQGLPVTPKPVKPPSGPLNMTEPMLQWIDKQE